MEGLINSQFSGLVFSPLFYQEAGAELTQICDPSFGNDPLLPNDPVLPEPEEVDLCDFYTNQMNMLLEGGMSPFDYCNTILSLLGTQMYQTQAGTDIPITLQDFSPCDSYLQCYPDLQDSYDSIIITAIDEVAESITDFIPPSDGTPIEG